MQSVEVQFPSDFALGAIPVLDDEFDAEFEEDILQDEFRDVRK